MSSRTLRRLQKQQERKEEMEFQNDSEGHMEEFRTHQPKFNAFNLLEAESADDGLGGDASGEESPGMRGKAPSLLKPTEKKKKKRKKKAKKPIAISEQTPSAQSQSSDPELDDIDRALKELSTLQVAQAGGNQLRPQDKALEDELSERLDQLLSIESRNLNAMNEMKKLFGSAVVENSHEDSGTHGMGRRRERNRRAIDLGRALTGRFNLASRGQDLSGLAPRRNVLMQGKDEWPRATSGGLGMEVVEKLPSDVTKYKLVHNSAYRDVQRQFDICVESMEPERMIELLQFNPYHISTLLQVSEIAKHQGDHAVSGDLLERALFNIGRSVHSSFGNRLREGKARMDFKVKENRELWLSGWRYIANLGMKGTWKTAYEWAKLLLSLDTDDPYALCLIIDQLAIRGREHEHFIELYSQTLFTRRWEIFPNIQCSLPLAYFLQGNATECRRRLGLAMAQYPWVFCRLAQELNITPVPKQIWGAQAPDKRHELLCELYLTRAKDIWNTPEVISVVVEVADTLVVSDIVIEAPQISLGIARHVLLSDIPAVTTHLPHSFAAGQISASDPLPPDTPQDGAERYYSYSILDTARQMFGFQERAADADPDNTVDDVSSSPSSIPQQNVVHDSGTVANVQESEGDHVSMEYPEEYLCGAGLRELQEFLSIHGMDRGNWGDGVDLTPVTGWVRILRREVPSHHWGPIMRQAAATMNSSLLYDLLSEELRLQNEGLS